MNELNNNEDYYRDNSKNISKSFIAGILLIVAGSISILMWIGLASIDILFIESTLLTELQSITAELSSESIKELLIICGSIGFFFSIFTILGGIMSLTKQMWKIALFGGIFGIFSIGPLFLSSIFSGMGLILILASRKEFN